MTKRLSLAALRIWLDNWAAWCRDREACYPQAFVVAGAEGQYRSPQRNHHEPPRALPHPIHERPAATLEDVLYDWGDGGHRDRVALKVEYVTLPSFVLAGAKAEKWTLIRAERAHMAPKTYWEAICAAQSRLAAELWDRRWEFPRAQAADR